MLLDDIETYLNTFGAYSQDGTNYSVVKYIIPDDPDAVIALLEFPAGKNFYAMGSSLAAPKRERVGLMVSVRGPQKDYGNARTVAETVYQRLDHFGGTLSGRDYFIEAMHPPILKQQDRNNRWQIETNFVVLKERG